MEFLPYSIYIEHRPIRIAFLINPAGDQMWFDRIFEYNRKKWGGRFNPIIFTDGKTIEGNWWKFLKDYDPDIIKSTVPLDEELQKKIHVFLSPLSVENVDTQCQYIGLSDDPISILPTKKNISRVSRGFFDDESSLVIFEVDKSSPELIKLFLSRNFGLLETGKMTPYHLRRNLKNCKIKTYKISGYDSLNQALLDLGDFRNRVVFPTQICAIPNSFKDVEYNYDNEKFTVIIGSSANELAYLWNRTLAIGNWMRTDITQIWLPKELVDNQAIKPGLGKFINRFVGQTGNSSYHGAYFITFSLKEEEIKKIASNFNKTLSYPKTSAKLIEPQFPNFGQHRSFFFLRRGLEFHRAHSNEEHLVLSEPDVEEGVMGGEYWFVDLYIQFRPERFTSIIGKDYWWQLPRRNNILDELRFF